MKQSFKDKIDLKLKEHNCDLLLLFSESNAILFFKGSYMFHVGEKFISFKNLRKLGLKEVTSYQLNNSEFKDDWYFWTELNDILLDLEL